VTQHNQTIERIERPWGWFELIAMQAGCQVKRINVAPSRQLSLQKHHQRSEHWVVIKGIGHVTLDGREFDLQVSQHVDIPIEAVHRLANRTTQPLEIVEVQFGSYLGEDDIVRLSDDYGR
jgi:mannose-6-phosphate isomerase